MADAESKLKISTLSKGLVGHWALDTAHRAKDRTPYSNNGTGAGGITIGGATDRHGQAGKATSFVQASGQSIVLSAGNLSMGAGDWSASTWVKFPVANNNAYTGAIIFDGAGIVFVSDKIGLLQGSDVVKGDSTSLSAGIWYLVTVTRTGAIYKVYKNGIDVSATLSNTGWGLSGAYGIGRGYSGWRLDGSLSDVRIYNRALSATEVRQLYELYE